MLHEALAITTGPVAIRWPKTEAREATETGSGLRARKVRQGSKVCLIAVGKLLGACEQAAAELTNHGVDPTVWDARLVAPLDPAMLDDAMDHELVVSVEDGIADGGVGCKIAESLRETARGGAGPGVVNCGVPTAYLPHGDAAGILSCLGLDGAGITRVVLEHL